LLGCGAGGGGGGPPQRETAELALADGEKDWYNTPLYKLINGRYVEGEIIHIQYERH
jgi:hypothetical protein